MPARVARALVEDTRYLIDNQNPTGYSQILAEIDGVTGRVTRINTYADEIKSQTDYIAGGGSDGSSSAPGAGATRQTYLHTDALGSIRSLTGVAASGDPLNESYNYTAFGSPSAAADGDRSLTSYAFTGQLRDPFTTLQYHRARWLNTNFGQWLSPDPVFDFLNNFANLYGYVGQSPLGGVDLSGLFTLVEMALANKIATVLHGIEEGFGIGAEIAAKGVLGALSARQAWVELLIYAAASVVLITMFVAVSLVLGKLFRAARASSPLYKAELAAENIKRMRAIPSRHFSCNLDASVLPTKELQVKAHIGPFYESRTGEGLPLLKREINGLYSSAIITAVAEAKAAKVTLRLGDDYVNRLTLAQLKRLRRRINRIAMEQGISVKAKLTYGPETTYPGTVVITDVVTGRTRPVFNYPVFSNAYLEIPDGMPVYVVMRALQTF